MLLPFADYCRAAATDSAKSVHLMIVTRTTYVEETVWRRTGMVLSRPSGVVARFEN
jgi:hypothetical protein